MRDAHARYIDALTRRVAPELEGAGQREAAGRLDLERTNLRTAMRHLVDIGNADLATDIAWRLYLYWWLRGFFYEVGLWMNELLERAPDGLGARARGRPLLLPVVDDVDDRTRAPRSSPASRSPPTCSATSGDPFGQAMALATKGFAQIALEQPVEDITALLEGCAETLHALGRRGRRALALIALGRISMAQGRLDEAIQRFEAALAAAEAGGDPFTQTVDPSPPRPPAAARGRDGCRGPRIPRHDAHLDEPSNTTRASPTPSRACAPSPPCAETPRSPRPWRAPPR